MDHGLVQPWVGGRQYRISREIHCRGWRSHENKNRFNGCSLTGDRCQRGCLETVETVLQRTSPPDPRNELQGEMIVGTDFSPGK